MHGKSTSKVKAPPRIERSEPLGFAWVVILAGLGVAIYVLVHHYQ